MVTVSDYAVRQNAEGKDFVVLILQGDMELVKSQTTGNFYATAKKCTITSTFNENTAAALIGKEIPGKIIKQDCEPYEFIVPETAEVLELSHRWVYIPDETPMKVQRHNEITFSKNGSLVEA
jgi:hypothetical protein